MKTQSSQRSVSDGSVDTASAAKLAVEWMSTTTGEVRTLGRLAAAEAKLAVASIGMMVVLAVLAAAFVIGAWGLVIAGLVMGLSEAGLPLWIVLLALGALHVSAAAVLWRQAVGMAAHADFGETRAHLVQAKESL